MGRW
jgi:hypothetical protein